jgi:hypothetical protein
VHLDGGGEDEAMTLPAGNMDVVNGGLPNTDPHMRDTGDLDSPFHVNLPDANLPARPSGRF